MGRLERLQWRVLRDVKGLRHAQIYGDRGQSQYGLDVVALSPDGSGVALQSKRYQRFGPSELKAAVKKFETTTRPFSVEQFIIGVSRDVKSTKVVNTLAEIRRALHPLELDLWDKGELSGLLRGAPEIVIEFFGLPTAEAFCLPFKLEAVSVPSADAVAIREALARTPEATTGATDLLREADNASDDDPERALALVEAAQAGLRDAGFRGHAAQHEGKRSSLLGRLGRASDAARQVLDEFWIALEQGLTITAQEAQRRLGEISKGAETDPGIRDSLKVCQTAMELYLNPLAYLPEITSLNIGESSDQVRLVTLASEIALANDNAEWLRRAHSTLMSLAEAATADRVARTRLRTLAAESTGDWSELLNDARKLLLGHDLLGLVSARYARYCALSQQFEEADALWDEAAGDACLAQLWTEASTWIFSRRAFRSRWNPFTGEELLPLQRALREMGPSRPIIAVDARAYEDALEDLRSRKLRSAAIAAQRALRDAVVTSDWVAEIRARSVLAGILSASDEPVRAARHLARAADTGAIKELGDSHTKQFIDTTSDLDTLNYWTVGATYQLIASQADLVPDALVGQIAKHIEDELSGAESGSLIDLRAFATSRYLGAIRALAGLAARLAPEQAETVLGHFERQPPVEPDHYRYHDENEAIAVALIAESQPLLRDRAIDHLVTLLARSQSARNATTLDAVDCNIGLAREQLTELAAKGNDWAQEVLAFHDPEDASPKAGQAALVSLSTPLQHESGVYSAGTNAVGQSILVRGLGFRATRACRC